MTNNTYTVYAKWAAFDAIEEIDVQAMTADDARALAVEILNDDYQDGWEIIKVAHRTGLYI